MLFLVVPGFIVIHPNQSIVLILCGDYKGTLKSNGCFWIVPIYQRVEITLRAQIHETSIIKVNDKIGNPVQVGAICVYQVVDTYKAAFDVEEYQGFVHLQVEAALRKLVGIFAYDDFDSE